MHRLHSIADDLRRLKEWDDHYWLHKQQLPFAGRARERPPPPPCLAPPSRPSHAHVSTWASKSRGPALAATLLSSTVIYFPGWDVARASAGQFGVAWRGAGLIDKVEGGGGRVLYARSPPLHQWRRSRCSPINCWHTEQRLCWRFGLCVWVRVPTSPYTSRLSLTASAGANCYFLFLDQCAAEVTTTINLMLDVGLRLFFVLCQFSNEIIRKRIECNLCHPTSLPILLWPLKH